MALLVLGIVNNVLQRNDDFIVTDLWHSHPEDRGGSVRNNVPSSFDHDGSRNDYSGDGSTFELMKLLPPTSGRVPEKANIYVPSRNLHIIYDDKSFEKKVYK